MEIRNTTKIDGRRDAAGEVQSGTRKTGGSDGAAKSGASAGGSGDRVTLTEAAQRLLQSAQAEAGAPVDAGKVEEIRNAIADGSYQVDSRSVAEKLFALDNPQRG